MKAKQRKRPVTTADTFAIEYSIECLQAARNSLRNAGADNAANYVARALKSTMGALRHAEGVYARQERQANGS